MTYYAIFDVNTEDYHHEIVTIESDQEQTVYISVYTYDSQHSDNSECENFRGESHMFFTHDRTNEYYEPMWGDSNAKLLDMQAGEKLKV